MKRRVPLPAPVGPYTAREYIGSGAWKIAFRATSNDINDVALLKIKDRSRSEEIARDVARALQLRKKHEFSDYLAKFITVLENEEGDWFIVEELLVRPLFHDAPLSDLTKWTSFARDLCRGLACIHEYRADPSERNLVHRDLKLDNCGVSKTGKAKIFDLGSLTTEGGKVECTILTRAPELFGKQTKFTSAADIWAMGATLYALRTGRYPFVEPTEVELRRELNDKLAAGEISVEEAIAGKASIDENIAGRARRPDAEKQLFQQIDEHFSASVVSTLKEMLSFTASKRQTARYYQEQWSKISDYVNGSGEAPDATGKWNQLQVRLRSVLHGELTLTVRQFGRIATEWDQDKARIKKSKEMSKAEIESLESLLTQVKNVVETRPVLRTSSAAAA